jgi:S-formylglutathione hydrolase FrmB
VFALTLINQHYQYYPNVGSLLGKEAQYEVDDAQLKQAQIDFRKTKKLPAHGFTIEKNIPGLESKFNTRNAFIWVPPAWVASPTPKLPVIELLAGYPGDPSDWTRAGFADETVEAFAATHNGRAPILVMPDTLGVNVSDTECVNSHLGQADTYLSVDVPNYIRRTFNAGTGEESFAVAGFSSGGTCALMISLRHPDVFRTFGNYAGLTSPTVGGYVNPPATISSLFGGSQAEYEQYDPLSLLKNSFQGLAGWFEVGGSDGDPDKAQETLVPLARSAGILTCVAVVPGAHHDFDFAARAFRDSLPWLAYRLDAGSEPKGVSCST